MAGLILPALVGCGNPTDPGGGIVPVEPIEELARPLTADEEALISSSNAFGVDLLREVVAVDDRPNVVLSPLSASMALGMILNGASGETFTDMRSTLGFDGLSQQEINESYRGLLDLLTGLDPSVALSIANSTWANAEYEFRSSFFDAVTESFDAAARTESFTDPATLEAINAWVGEKTKGKIEEILEELDPDMALLLLNAVYFDGTWTTQFDPDETTSASFARADGSTATVDMMSLRGESWPVGGTGGLSAVELPYGGGAFSMVVALPPMGTSAREALAEMEGSDWDALIGSLDSRELDVLSLPRFTLSYDVHLNDPLTDMGMGVAFSSDADFSELSPTPLCIDFVRQKTFIEVDEAGTTAAAVTGVGAGPTSFSGFVADRPFVFAIRERLSGTILFMGLVGDPSREDSGPADPVGPCAPR